VTVLKLCIAGLINKL